MEGQRVWWSLMWILFRANSPCRMKWTSAADVVEQHPFLVMSDMIPELSNLHQWFCNEYWCASWHFWACSTLHGKINGVFLSYSSSRRRRIDSVFSHIRNVYVLQILMLDVTKKKRSYHEWYHSTAQLGEVTPKGCVLWSGWAGHSYGFQRGGPTPPSAGMKLVVSLDFVDRHYLKMCETRQNAKRIAGPKIPTAKAAFWSSICVLLGLLL